ncbi:MAG: hypothetical protein KIS81_09900 [Maricaulaceae bacterium]|nr:hypothetical protein [Maricaulaceae bacterium]
MTSALWWRDFRLENGAVAVRKTGARVPVEPGVIGEGLSWFAYYLCIEAQRLTRRGGPRVCFLPDRPRPWYLIWTVLHAAGGRIVSMPAKADLVFHFEDATLSAPAAAPPGAPGVNLRCLDVSKSRVAAAHETAFRYPLAVDPASWTGPMVEKAEANGAHDGRIVEGPVEPRPGQCYQRLVDNLDADGMAVDLRCPTVGGEIAAVFVKRRPASNRFANHNASVRLAAPEDVFSADERARIRAFTQAIGMDWGGLDVLRDARDNRLYVVDANKTDMGPPTALPLRDKLKATEWIAAALLRHSAGKTGESSPDAVC